MKRHCPKLWPLMQRFGWFMGLMTWDICRRRGCDWHGIGHSYKQGERPLPNGCRFCWGMAKVRCSCCESIRLIRLEVTVLADGVSYTVHSPDGRLCIEGRDLKLK